MRAWQASKTTTSPQAGEKAGDLAFRAWLVDLDGTLYHARWVRLAMAAELLVSGWRAIPMLRLFRREQERLRDHSSGASITQADPFQRQLEQTARRCARQVPEVAAVVDEWMIRRPSRWLRLCRRRTLIEEIQEFRGSGGAVAVVSDYPAQSKLRAMGIADLFDAVVAVGEPGGPTQFKPSPDGYLRAASVLAISPDQCLVIGDRDDADGEAAKRAGMGYRSVR